MVLYCHLLLGAYVFNKAVHTNNDIERQHNRINKSAAGRCSLQFYPLVNLLHKEEKLISIHIKLMSKRKSEGYSEDAIGNYKINCSFYETNI